MRSMKLLAHRHIAGCTRIAPFAASGAGFAICSSRTCRGICLRRPSKGRERFSNSRRTARRNSKSREPCPRDHPERTRPRIIVAAMNWRQASWGILRQELAGDIQLGRLSPGPSSIAAGSQACRSGAESVIAAFSASSTKRKSSTPAADRGRERREDVHRSGIRAIRRVQARIHLGPVAGNQRVEKNQGIRSVRRDCRSAGRPRRDGRNMKIFQQRSSSDSARAKSSRQSGLAASKNCVSGLPLQQDVELETAREEHEDIFARGWSK